MGKRARRRAREAGETEPMKKGPQRLGQVGPYMVCRECKEPLTLFSLVNREDEWDEEKIVYIHPQEHLDVNTGIISDLPGFHYDHEAVPVEGDPLSASTTCDFCSSPDTKYVFVPRKPIRITDPMGMRGDLDYSSPWNCCEGCMPAVRKKDLSKMLDRAVYSKHSEWAAMASGDPMLRRLIRSQVRTIYTAYLASNPAGPYEVKIRPKRKPFGKPGSRRGM